MAALRTHGFAVLLLAGATGANAADGMLLRRAVLPAATFAGGPPTGRYADRDSYGERLDQPQFAAQPVQGVSSIKPGPRRGTWWALSDNGFGSKWNSLDYRTCIYLFDESLRLLERVALRDPQRHFPHTLILESDASRPLTGGDIDPESLVVTPDGTFWIGDEFGPWLLHFSRAGNLLAAPVPATLPDGTALLSPNNPAVLTGRGAANVRASSGFEGLAAIGRGASLKLYALLEKPLTIEMDPRDLRLLEFDPRRARWTGRAWRYRLDSPQHAVGELASAADGGLLFIERDNLQGEAARTKKIFRTAAPDPQAPDAVLDKSMLADLLLLGDPQHLAGPAEVFRFPYDTIESVQSLDARTLLVVNDNNFPATGGREPGVPNPTEWIWIRLRD